MTPYTSEERSLTAQYAATEGAVLRLVVRNHPGVMSHVCGLFARRGFNVDGIICLPLAGAARSVILLLVPEDDRLGQMICQLQKLEDVLEIGRNVDAPQVFATVQAILLGAPGSAPGMAGIRRTGASPQNS